MSINYTVKMKSQKLDEQTLIKAFEDLGYRYENIDTLPKGTCIDLFETLGFCVYLTDVSNYPYNSWDTIFYEDEFVFERVLEFRFDKEYSDLEKRYSIMLEVVFGLLKNMREEAIFISNDDRELCLFKEDGEILLNNQSGIWNRSSFKDIILNKKISYLHN